ncbi:hypothetical protein SteCoe_35058 [Stentor coeruleus]|uniref:B box-type domain-containing protein n=1 Tax=Stentor coeruleus TaxID=5963 RepID=A0A1R2AT68_9CILI|nr:hypothetical protein SteCoe_35058 [Stentor coeruleus]
MQRCLNCTNTSDFVCYCQSSNLTLCYKHASSHFVHEEIYLIPTLTSHRKIQPLIDILNGKKKKIKGFISQAEEIIGKCINDIHKAFTDIETKLNQCLSDIDNAIDKLKTLHFGKAEKYLAVHSFLFQENADLLNSDMVIFQQKYVYIEHITKKLFKVFSTTETLSQGISLCNLDKEFYEKEIERVKIQQKEKILRKTNNSNDDRSIMKSNRVKNRLLCDNFNGEANKDYYIDHSLLYSDYSRKITRISYTSTRFTDNQFEKIVQIFKNYEKIKSIEIEDVISNEYQFTIFCEYLSKVNYLKVLCLSYNLLGDANIQLLCKSITNMKRLYSLNLFQNLISNAGCIHLAKILSTFSNLMELDLGYNNIGPEGAEALKQSLPQLKLLEELSIDHNQLLPEGIMNIMIGIHTLPHISILNIAMNDGFDEGGLIIAEYARYLKCLTKLYIDIVTSADVKQSICEAVMKSCKVICTNDNDRVVIKRWQLD